MVQNRLCNLLKIRFPLIQAGMVWCSGWELCSAVSNAGGLGVLGAGSMYPEVLEEHILKCKEAGAQNFAVNLPLLYPQIDDHIATIIKHKVPVVITSAGNPAKYTALFKSHGIKVMHVVSSVKFALKAEAAGVDAVIAEGFEAGGHNGREETTTLCLIPQVAKAIKIPLVAAGGIASGRAMLAVMVLGGDGVQVGSRFVLSEESSAHLNYKNALLQADEGSTELTLKELTPVRLFKNEFYASVKEAYANGASDEELAALLGRGRAKKGMFEGNLVDGELEIGQIISTVKSIKPAAEIVQEMVSELRNELNNWANDPKFSF